MTRQPSHDRPVTGSPGAGGHPAIPPRTRRARLARMPKAELHLHLDGSLRPETALDLAASRRMPERSEEVPDTLDAMRAALAAPAHGPDQVALLRVFDLPVALLQDAEALERVAGELVADVAADGVRYVEIRWGPLLHVRRGLGLRDGIAAVCRGATVAGAREGVAVRLICVALRSHEPARNVELAEAAGTFRDSGLTGWDLAGPEATWPDPLLHREAFAAARAAGLRITLHAGEWGGAAQVRRALHLEPERIAHGAGAIDDPALVDELIERGVCLDLCPTSNVQAGVVPSLAAHPLARLHRAGVRVSLSTDDRTVSAITLTDEYEHALDAIGLTPEELWAINGGALEVAFADEATLAPLRRSFDAWAAAEGWIGG